MREDLSDKRLESRLFSTVAYFQHFGIYGQRCVPKTARNQFAKDIYRQLKQNRSPERPLLVIAKLWQLACLLAGNVESCAENLPTIANRLLHGTSRAAIAETTLTLGFVVGYKLAAFLPIYQLGSTNYAAG